MDVRCDKCGREYLFDDSKVTESGVVVRCTRCGHTFRLRRHAMITTEPLVSGGSTTDLGQGYSEGPSGFSNESARASGAEPLQPREWLIRQENGNVIAFQELATLHQWIAARKVTRSDEISRSGNLWRKLGSVPEFEGLFERVTVSSDPAFPFQTTHGIDAANEGAAPRAEADGPAPSFTGMPAFQTPPSLAPQAAPRGSTAPMGSQRVDSEAQYELGDPKHVGDRPAPAWATSDAAISQRLSVSGQGDDDDLPMARWQRRRRWKIALVSMVLMIGAAFGGLYVFQRPLLMKLFGREEAPASNVTVIDTKPIAPPAAVSASSPVPRAPAPVFPAPAAPDAAAPYAPAPAAVAALAAAPPAPPLAVTAPAKKVEKASDEEKKPKKAAPQSKKQILAKANRMREKAPRKALALYDEVLGDGPSAPAHAGKGWAFLELGEHTLAAREFQVAIRMGKRGDTYIGLGTAYRKLNQRDKARATFTKYLDMYPDGEEAPVARTNLDSLR